GLNHAYGPGRFRHLAFSDDKADPLAPVGKGPAMPAKGAPAKGEPVMKLTRIDFKGWMFAKNSPKTNYKEATFRTDVEVFNVPANNIDARLDPEKLPKDGFFMMCQELHVLSKQAKGKTSQSMVAKSQVFFRNTEIYGYCDELDYDDADDVIIFTALPG